MSSVSALKMPTSVRSVSSRPRPTYCRPVYSVSAPLTVKRVGRDGDGVLAHGAQVEDQPHAGRVGGLAGRLEQPELEELVVA